MEKSRVQYIKYLQGISSTSVVAKEIQYLKRLTSDGPIFRSAEGIGVTYILSLAMHTSDTQLLRRCLR
jgi:hypothetical protein